MINFEDLEPYVTGDMLHHPYVEKFVIYSDFSPSLGEIIKYKDAGWEVVYSEELKTDEEFEQGFKYTLIRMEKTILI